MKVRDAVFSLIFSGLIFAQYFYYQPVPIEVFMVATFLSAIIILYIVSYNKCEKRNNRYYKLKFDMTRLAKTHGLDDKIMYNISHEDIIKINDLLNEDRDIYAVQLLKNNYKIREKEAIIYLDCLKKSECGGNSKLTAIGKENLDISTYICVAYVIFMAVQISWVSRTMLIIFTAILAVGILPPSLVLFKSIGIKKKYYKLKFDMTELARVYGLDDKIMYNISEEDSNELNNLLKENKKSDAIKLLRNNYKMSLSESSVYIDCLKKSQNYVG